MLGFHGISVAPISALVQQVVGAVIPTVTQRPTGGWENAYYRTRWSVKKDDRYYYFDTPEEALDFYEKMVAILPEKKKAKKVTSLGKSEIYYAGTNLNEIKVNKRTGVEILREAASSVDMQRYIENLINGQIKASLMAIAREEEELLLLAAAIA